MRPSRSVLPLALLAALAPSERLASQGCPPTAVRPAGAMPALPRVTPPGGSATLSIAPDCRPAGPAPTLTVVATQRTSITLGWAPVSNAVGYTVNRAIPNSAHSLILTPNEIAATSFTNQGLLPGTGYSYVVTADFGAQGAYRPTTSVPLPASTAPPVNPSGFSGTVGSNHAVTLKWTAIPDASSYWIGGPGLVAQKLPPATTTITTSALAPGTYRYVLIAYWTDGTTNVGDEAHPSTATVTVPPPPSLSMTVAPSAVVIERAKSNTVTVTIARNNGLTGDVAVTTSGLPPGLKATPLTIGASATTGVVTLTADTGAAFGASTATVKAVAANSQVTQSRTVNVILSRLGGSFVEVTPNTSAPGQSATSPNGVYTVAITTGSAIGLSTSNAATFRKGTTALGPALGFYIGPTTNLGGAGYCAASRVGVVLSGNAQQLGFSTDHVFSLARLDTTGPALFVRRTFAVNAYKQNPPYFFAPRILLSPDCTLALVAGANTFGASANVLQVFDLLTGNKLGSDVPFGTPSFSAKVAVVNGKPVIQVTVDGSTVSIAMP